jgi:hypothetical protein
MDFGLCFMRRGILLVSYESFVPVGGWVSVLWLGAQWRDEYPM